MQLSKETLLHGGTYIIEKTLGHGSFGITYLAVHTALERKVAIKEFFMKELNSRGEDGSITGMTDGSLSYNYGQKFKKEALNLARLDHPNIVRVTDSFEENGTYYYVMDYIEGQNLNDYLKQNSVSQQEAVAIITDVAKALMYMHDEKNMLHLDLKPGNIMRRSSDGHIYLIDFGLSKHYSNNGQPETSTTIGLGTPGYAPIEQSNQAKNGEFRPTIDVYALGATLFKLLTHETPPPAADIVSDDELIEDKLRENGIAGSIIDAVVKAMLPNVKKRTQTIKAFVESLPTSLLSPSATNQLSNVNSEETMFIDVTPSNNGETKEKESLHKEAEVKTAKEKAEVEAHAKVEAERNEREEQEHNLKEEKEAANNGVSRKSSSIKIGNRTNSEKSNFNIKYVLAGIIGLCLIIGAFSLFGRGDNVSDENTPTDSILYADNQYIDYWYVEEDGDTISVMMNYTGPLDSLGFPEGECKITYLDEDIRKSFEGIFPWDENGKIVYKNGDTFEGSVCEGRPVNGTYYLKDKSKYFVSDGDGFDNSVAKGDKYVVASGIITQYPEPYIGTWYDKSGNVIQKIKNGWVTKDSKLNEKIYFDEECKPKSNNVVASPPPTDAPQVAEILDILDNNEDNEIFEVVEQQPTYPGGMENLMKWLSSNLVYPSTAQKNGVQGRVIVQFVINKDGSIVETKVIKSVDPDLDKEAIRVVSKMPKWTPGKHKGKLVRVRFTLPITFRLQ